jgi:predicted NBD/HSP70 family sugar kinase
MPLSGEFGHTPVAGNKRPCGCGAVGCLETLVSERGLLESLAAGGLSKTNRSQPGASTLSMTEASWERLVSHVAHRGIEPWLAETLDITADVIAGALNVLGIHRVVVTGRLAELPGCLEHMSARVKQGALWGRFGDVVVQSAPHRRAAGLVATGLDRLVLPQNEEQSLILQHTK